MKKGFTLVELIIYVAMIGVVVIGFLNFGLNVIYTGEKSEIRQEVQRNATYALQRVLSKIKEANAVNAGSSTFDSHPGVLSLEMEDSAVDPTVFDISGGILRMTEGVSSPVNLIPAELEATNLVFSNLSVSGRTSNIKIELTARHRNYNVSNLAEAEMVIEGSASIRKQANP